MSEFAGGIHEYLAGGLVTADVSVVVCSLSTRPELLAECIAGIDSQTLQPRAAYIGIDFALIGEAQNQNNLARLVDTSWIAFCHDDDIWLPNHLQVMMDNMLDTDIVFSDYILEGRGDWHPGHYCNDWSMLMQTNWIPPSACMMRTEVFNAVGGWPPLDNPRGWVDWAMWKTLYQKGYRMKCTCEKTFRYRFHVNANHSNGSLP